MSSKNSIYKLKHFEIIKPDQFSDKFIVKFSDGQFLRVSFTAKSIIQKLTGNTDESIIKSLRDKNINITKKDLKRFVDEYLGPLGVVLLPDKSYRIKEEHNRLWFHKSLFKANKFFGISKYLKFLFNKIFVFAVFLCLSLSVFWVMIIQGGWKNLNLANLARANVLIIFVVSMLSLLFHEIGHVSALYYYSIDPGDIGVGIYLFRPVAFTDMTGAWALNRKQRVVTDLGGIYFNTVGLLIFFIIMLFSGFSATFFVCSVFMVLDIAYNFDPFLRWDGYWILSDWLDMPNIHKKSIAITKVIFNKLRGKKGEMPKEILELPKRKRKLILSYIIIYLSFTVIFTLTGLIYFVMYSGSFIQVYLQLVQDVAKHNWSLLLIHIYSNLIAIIVPLLFIVFVLFSLGKIGKKKSISNVS